MDKEMSISRDLTLVRVQIFLISTYGIQEVFRITFQTFCIFYIFYSRIFIK